jgi:hypothetical protein
MSSSQVPHGGRTALETAICWGFGAKGDFEKTAQNLQPVGRENKDCFAPPGVDHENECTFHGSFCSLHGRFWRDGSSQHHHANSGVRQSVSGERSEPVRVLEF